MELPKIGLDFILFLRNLFKPTLKDQNWTFFANKGKIIIFLVKSILLFRDFFFTFYTCSWTSYIAGKFTQSGFTKTGKVKLRILGKNKKTAVDHQKNTNKKTAVDQWSTAVFLLALVLFGPVFAKSVLFPFFYVFKNSTVAVTKKKNNITKTK